MASTIQGRGSPLPVAEMFQNTSAHRHTVLLCLSRNNIQPVNRPMSGKDDTPTNFAYNFIPQEAASMSRQGWEGGRYL